MRYKDAKEIVVGDIIRTKKGISEVVKEKEYDTELLTGKPQLWFNTESGECLLHKEILAPWIK